MANEQYGRRPDHDGICKRCKTDGLVRALASVGTGRTFAYYKAPIKNKKGRVVHQAEWVHYCPYHQREVEAAA